MELLQAHFRKQMAVTMEAAWACGSGAPVAGFAPEGASLAYRDEASGLERYGVAAAISAAVALLLPAMD